ncbi:transposase [Nocardia sp. NPDC047648]|uniref:transposase n=1 Tax=Nocardia sp. NPDC047648 TaxID=3155625 RepID=UPI0034004CC8
MQTGSPWRDLPPVFGPWQTVWKRHRRYVADGTWDRMPTALLALADSTGNLDGRFHDRAGASAPCRRPAPGTTNWPSPTAPESFWP